MLSSEIFLGDTFETCRSGYSNCESVDTNFRDAFANFCSTGNEEKLPTEDFGGELGTLRSFETA